MQILIDKDSFQTRHRMQLSSGDKSGIILAVMVLVMAILAHCACRIKMTHNRIAETMEFDTMRLQEVVCKPSTSND